MNRALAACALSAALVTACGGDGGVPMPATGQVQQLRMETYCSIEGLEPALRQTFVVVDASALTPVQEATEFAAHNAGVRDTVMAFADPGPATDAGRAAPRERVTLMVAPPDGSAPRQVFTGCLPSFSNAERAMLGAGDSRVASFFTGGREQQVADDIEQFRAMIAGALIQSARALPTGASDTESRLFGSLAALGEVFRSSDTVPRIVLVTDAALPVAAGDASEARRAGFDEAARTGVDLGNAEVMVVGAGSGNEIARQYLEAFLLRINGHLAGWSADVSGLVPNPAPVSLARYSGAAAYPGGDDQLIQVRLARDTGGKLVNSWLVLMGLETRAIPLTGQAVCKGDGSCVIRSDRGGFAQSWVAERGAEPVFENEAPFGGMREWSIQTTGESLTGEVFDSAVTQVGDTPGQRSIAINATLQPGANF